MNSHSFLLVPFATFLLLTSAGSCGDSGGTSGSTGASGMGDASGAGGNAGTGATSGSGAAAGQGGTTGTGAAAGTGGTTGTGAAAGTGGASGSAGASGGSGAADAGRAGNAGDRDAAVDSVAPGHPLNLGTAGTYVILAKSGISTVPASAVTGNLGISPAAGTLITGFSLKADSTSTFSTSTQVVGKVYAADDTTPTPSNLTTAVGDMELAFTEAAGRAPDVTELGAGNIGGMTLSPGVYKWGTGLTIATTVTLTGRATDVWIFQIAQDFTMSSAAKVLLTGGAVPKNVFWQVAGLVDFGTTAHCEGVVLTQTAVTLRTGASLNGRLLAQTAVNIDTSTVVAPAP
ncbi:MAG TPA: ice-binding family protein [Polyangiaceae bacterium]|nr:ice-binding family protein [Polyangiaceae bacterium]